MSHIHYFNCVRDNQGISLRSIFVKLMTSAKDLVLFQFIIVFFLKNFYCYSATVVLIFSPLPSSTHHPPPVNPHIVVHVEGSFIHVL